MPHSSQRDSKKIYKRINQPHENSKFSWGFCFVEKYKVLLKYTI
ncbi:hypothetical protein ANACAC_03214 [Anaerostipes caccae L1-92]|uniref:Uncharacterized protein n=1 Tax=Anaerostipes caccae (strain DSM 14662 / CCUG 47493 / JCM 13470 / NCIMB 13811 / L1-92) TaxID=411490 RepID=B0MGX7_ANACD|nr:hypothetical protein ANACAC_03214 [Anaerostipes caccae L1-92]